VDEPGTEKKVRNRGKIWKELQEKMAITASDARRRGFLPPHRRRGACCCYPPWVLGAALEIGKESLSWQRFEG
jgi:hypothetical protein